MVVKNLVENNSKAIAATATTPAKKLDVDFCYD